MTITVEEVGRSWPGVLDQLQNGPITITLGDLPVARIVMPVPLIEEESPKLKMRPSGTLKGTVLYMAPDFDAPLEEFAEYTP